MSSLPVLIPGRLGVYGANYVRARLPLSGGHRSPVGVGKLRAHEGRTHLLWALQRISREWGAVPILEPDRVRLIPRDEAIKFWTSWWEKEPPKVERGNVALAKNGTRVSGATNGGDLIDGNTTRFTGHTGFASGTWPCKWDITLSQPYMLRQIRLLIHDSVSAKFYRYALETSSDGKKFVPLIDRSKGEWRSWQTISFAPRVVKTIRLTGVYGSSNKWYCVVELEAYCIPPAKPVVPKYPSKP